jgi:hypothetical protein
MPRISLNNINNPPPADPPKNQGQPIEVPPEEPEVKTPSPPGPVSADALDGELQDKSGSSVFAAFSAFPRDVTFADEQEGENIILLLRAHIITNVPWILVSLVLLVLPLIVFPLIGAAGLPLGVGRGLILFLLWYLVTFTYAFLSFLYWYFNVYIVTDERVVDVDWYAVLYHKVSSAQIAHIEDVSASQGGFFASVFDYGNIQIQTAAEQENFEFVNVPHPQLVAKEIQKLMQTEETEHEVNPKP